jgi:hypothetical protein
VAATKPANNLRRFQIVRRIAALLGSLLAAGGTRAVDLPDDAADVMYHSYSGGGMTASGPALLVRKKLADKVSLSASYYVDSVSNASIDVVTTASPYHEVRKEFGIGADYVYRDSKITLSALSSHEPDYTANTRSLDVTQETFGGMTSVSLGFTQGSDQIRKHNSPEFSDVASHWQYRLGVTQILTPRWIMSANAEAIADAGFLGSPYRIAYVFGAAVPENTPRTRSSRAVKFRLLGSLNSRDAVHADYRYFWDNWDIKAHTVELGYSRYFGDKWLTDAGLRYYKQSKALFYSNDASAASLYISRNRQLSTFNSVGLETKISYSARKVPGQYEIKYNAAYEFTRYMFKDFTTDVQSNSPYSYNAHIFQVFVSATF